MPFSYLALGDSYTIGEQVPIYESFPYQLVQLLRTRRAEYFAPEIIAKTGWTTDELMEGISNTHLLPQYDLVTLLIGVNNQYRGRPVDNFQVEFEMLLKKAIVFSKSNNVLVISIPDWGVTPFAKERDVQKIAIEIDAYNDICRLICDKHKIVFIDITTQQRRNAADPTFVTGDGLHPSGKEYAIWAARIFEILKT